MDNRSMALSRGSVAQFHHARGTTLTVTAGSLWITQDDDSRDITLDAGQTWTIERHGTTLVQAQRDSVVAVVGRAASVRGAPAWSQRLRNWRERLIELRAPRRWIPYY